MKLVYIILSFVLTQSNAMAQQDAGYIKAITAYQKKYAAMHEVVKGKEKKYFRFFPADENYVVKCSFEKLYDTAVVIMKTSGKKISEKYFTRFGKITFAIHDTALQLTVYRSQSLQQDPQYKNYLFIPFTDITTGDETYGSGRYIDILTTDIKGNTVAIDFNKAYNPYCAYTTGYNCPIPPKENHLTVAINAGEKSFAKAAGH